MDLYFLTFEDILEIHVDQIKRYGGRDGIRDQNLLLSAIAQPYSSFGGQYLHRTIFDKAAAYLFHLCKNHPFIDGNKRVASVAALVFLSMNDKPIDYKENAFEKLVLAVATSNADKEEISNFLSKGLG